MDLIKEFIFVVLVVYYYMGGLVIDVYGEIFIGGFWVCGEVVGIGVYGVNCFVSNLFLEVFVFVNWIVIEIKFWVGGGVILLVFVILFKDDIVFLFDFNLF